MSESTVSDAVGVEQSEVAGSTRENLWQPTPETIVSAVEQIVKIANPVRVVAFGSRARGEHRPDSDLDLAVIVDRYDPKTDERPVWRCDIKARMELDVLVYDLARESLLTDSPISLQSEVRREGVTLYDRQAGRVDTAAAARLV